MIALEIVSPEKTRGNVLYIHKRFGRSRAGTFQMISAFVEKCEEACSKLAAVA